MRIESRTPRAAAYLVVVLALMTPATASSAAGGAGSPDRSREPTPGAPGAGDPYFPRDGNGGYQVRRYDLDLRFSPNTGRLRGRASIRAAATQDLSRFHLDFRLRAASVRVDGRPAAFRRAHGRELVVEPREALTNGSRFTVVVRYAGVPDRVRTDGFSPWQQDEQGAFVNGEPHHATVWFPVNDHPSDKATYDVRVTVPSTWEAVSAGRLAGHRDRAQGTTWRWRVNRPMASYLTFLGIGQYDLVRGRAQGLPYTYAVSRRLPAPQRAVALRAMRRSPRHLAWLQERLGRYPFDSVGGTAQGGFDVATIESQTAPVYGRYLLQRPSLIRDTVVHEMAHQWFGDSVSLTRWSDLWLNEGFATYVGWWWRAGHGGRSLDRQWLDTYEAIPAEDDWWTIAPGDPGPGEDLFTTVYARGAMTLQALRNVIGNGAFRSVLRTWARERRYGYGTTADFVALSEWISGVELDHFFQVWLYEPVRPEPRPDNGFPARD